MKHGGGKKIIALAVIAIVVTAGVFAYVRAREREKLSRFEVTGTIECEEVAVGSKEGGRVAEVLVKEGARVGAGQEMILLDSKTQEAALQEARAAEKMALAALELLRSGSRAEDIEAARAAAKAAESQTALVESGTRSEQVDAALADYQAALAQYTNAKQVSDRLGKLNAAGVVSKQDADNARTSMQAAEKRRDAALAMYEMARRGARPQEKDTARDRLAEANARLRRVENGPRTEEIAQAEAAVEQARARVQSLETRLDETRITSPANAAVDTLDLHPGDLLSPGEEAARLVLDDALWVRIFVPDDALSNLKQGSRIPVYVDSLPGRRFSGVVSRIARKAEFTPRNVQTPEGRSMQVFRVKIVLSDPKKELRPGMTAIVRLPEK